LLLVHATYRILGVIAVYAQSGLGTEIEWGKKGLLRPMYCTVLYCS